MRSRTGKREGAKKEIKKKRVGGKGGPSSCKREDDALALLRWVGTLLAEAMKRIE